MWVFFCWLQLRCSYVPWSKVAILGMVISPLVGNPYNGYINPYYWVDEFIPYGNNGSWSTLAHIFDCLYVYWGVVRFLMCPGWSIKCPKIDWNYSFLRVFKKQMGKPNSGVFPGIRIPWNAPPTLRVVKGTLEIWKVYPGPETKSKFALENRPKLPQKEKLHLNQPSIVRWELLVSGNVMIFSCDILLYP